MSRWQGISSSDGPCIAPHHGIEHNGEYVCEGRNVKTRSQWLCLFYIWILIAIVCMCVCVRMRECVQVFMHVFVHEEAEVIQHGGGSSSITLCTIFLR